MSKNIEKQIYFGSKDEVKESIKLGEFLNINSGKDYKHLSPGDIPVFGTGGLMTHVSDFLYEEDAIGIGRKGTIDKPYLINGPFWTVDTLFWCTSKLSLYYTLQVIKQINLKKYDEGSTLPSLSSSNLKNITVNIHNRDLIDRISTSLSQIDNLIKIQREKLELVNSSKNKISRSIFENLIGEKVYIENLCQITTGKLDANAMEINGKYRFYTCAKNYYSINSYAFDDDVLLISGNGANVGYIHSYNGKFNAYQRTYVLHTFSCNKQFLNYSLKEFLPKRIFSTFNGGNTPFITKDVISKMKLPLPNISDQDKIANILSQMDKLIEIEEKKLEQLEKMKKYHLQQFFN